MWRLGKKYKDDEPVPMTQYELNVIFEKPDMNMSFKYSYLAKTLLMTLFYLPLLPVGTLISIAGIIFTYFIEKFNLVHTYKRPEMINYTLCMFYIRYFKFFIFVYAIGNWIFLSEISDQNVFGILSLIITGVICVFPFHSFLKCNFLAIKEFEILDKDYYHYYFDFMRDYERTNPITRKKGNRNYIEKMKEKELISEEMFKEMTFQLAEDNLNVIEAYYKNNSSQRPKINVNRPKNNNLKNKNKANNYKMEYFKNMIGVDFDEGTKEGNTDNKIEKNQALLNFAENLTSYYRDPTAASGVKVSQGKKLFGKNKELKQTKYEKDPGNLNNISNLPFSSYKSQAENNQNLPQINPDYLLDIPMAKSQHFNENQQNLAGEDMPIVNKKNNNL